MGLRRRTNLTGDYPRRGLVAQVRSCPSGFWSLTIAEIPGTWLCRNGMKGTLIEGGDLAEPKKVKVPRTPWDMLRERRSIEELEELLKERLEIIKSRRRGS